MTAHIARASSNDEILDCLASFSQDAERFLAAVYHFFQEIYGDRAARSAAEAWLRILEEPGELPDLTSITAAAIAFSVSNVVKPSASRRSTSAMSSSGELQSEPNGHTSDLLIREPRGRRVHLSGTCSSISRLAGLRGACRDSVTHARN